MDKPIQVSMTVGIMLVMCNCHLNHHALLYCVLAHLQGPPGDTTIIKDCPDSVIKTPGGSPSFGAGDFKRRKRSVQESDQV